MPGHSSRHEEDWHKQSIWGEHMRIRSRIVARGFKSEDRPASTAALKATISIAANHQQPWSIIHLDVTRAYFKATAWRLVMVRLPVEDIMDADAGNVSLLKKSM